MIYNIFSVSTVIYTDFGSFVCQGAKCPINSIGNNYKSGQWIKWQVPLSRHDVV